MKPRPFVQRIWRRKVSLSLAASIILRKLKQDAAEFDDLDAYHAGRPKERGTQ